MHARQSVTSCRVTEPAGNSAKSSTSLAAFFFGASAAAFFGASAAALTAWVFFAFTAAFFVFVAPTFFVFGASTFFAFGAVAFAPFLADAALPAAGLAFAFFAAAVLGVLLWFVLVAGIGSRAVQSAP